MHTSRPTMLTGLAVLLIPLISACGGDDKASTSDAADTTTVQDSTGDDGSGSTAYEPGGNLHRVVNLLDAPVDLYARTADGLIEAFLVQSGLGPGEVSDHIAPPDPGSLAVLTAGAADPTCVATCPHILIDSRATADTGSVITEVLYYEGSTARSFTVWEQPPAGAAEASNRMPDADPAAGLLIPLAVALTDADFGLQMADTAGSGCLIDRAASGVLVGGNQTPVFAYDGDSIEVVFHANDDRDCSGEIVGGPFTISGGPSSRTLLILTGSPGSMDAIVLTLGADAPAPPDSSDSDDSGDSGDATAVAISAMAEFLAQALPEISAEEATCIATGMVEDLGAEQLLDSSGLPLDYANIGGALGDAFAASADAASAACGVSLSG